MSVGNTFWYLFLFLILNVKTKLSAFPTDDPRGAQYISAVTRAIEIYNEEDSNTSLFKLLKVDSNVNTTPATNPLIIHFILKETICLKSKNQKTQECPFKSDGLLKVCSLHIFMEQANKVICDTVTKQHFRQRRSIPVSKVKCRNEKQRRCVTDNKKYLPGGFSPINNIQVNTLKNKNY
ncbi:cathelicidin-1 [Bombina bombina]|uniref:cathelicidin-1 n=1 Tax=Bombina bombina TaxID=8345 RepID=UPI00235A61BE|nr:cathelicidin-1 [Bombina bombina]